MLRSALSLEVRRQLCKAKPLTAIQSRGLEWLGIYLRSSVELHCLRRDSFSNVTCETVVVYLNLC